MEQGSSLVHQAVKAVRAHIQSYDLKVGDPLPGDSHFASEVGVSRAVMREAFGALAALRVLDVANGRRARVGAMDGSVMATSINHAVATAQISVIDVWEVRRTIEVRIAALAAERRTDEQAAEIQRLAQALADNAADLSLLTQHDISFHQRIATASGNALFAQMVRSYAALMEVAVPQAWETRATREETDAIIERHHEVARAIAARNAAAAAAAMEAHFDTSIGDLLKRGG